MLIARGELEAVRAEWATACALEGWRIRCGEHEGRVIRLNPHGAIELETPGGSVELYSGDINLLDKD